MRKPVHILTVTLAAGIYIAALGGAPLAYAQEREISPFGSRVAGKTEVVIQGLKATAWASSVLEEKSGRYAVFNAFDGDSTTAWVEGEAGAGEGAYLTIEFPDKTTIDGFTLRPGYTKNVSVFTANAIPRTIDIYLDGNKLNSYAIGYDLEFIFSGDPKSRRFESCIHTPNTVNLKPRAVIFREPVAARTITLKIAEAITGSRYDDLAISEWIPLVSSGAGTPDIGNRLRDVLSSFRDEKSLQGHLAENARIADLREVYIYNNESHKLPSRAEHSPFYYRVPADDARPGNTLGSRYLSYTQDALIESVLVIYKHPDITKVIGAVSYSYGDGDWIELYPEVRITNDTKVLSLDELSHVDGVPGCRHVIPQTSKNGGQQKADVNEL